MLSYSVCVSSTESINLCCVDEKKTVMMCSSNSGVDYIQKQGRTAGGVFTKWFKCQGLID